MKKTTFKGILCTKHYKLFFYESTDYFWNIISRKYRMLIIDRRLNFKERDKKKKNKKI